LWIFQDYFKYSRLIGDDFSKNVIPFFQARIEIPLISTRHDLQIFMILLGMPGFFANSHEFIMTFSKRDRIRFEEITYKSVK